MAVRNIKRAVSGRQFVCTGLLPLNRGSVIGHPERSCHVQHARIEIDARHDPGRAHLHRRKARHYSSAASNIDYAFAQLRPSEVYQDGGPWPKHSRDQLPFVHFGRTTSDLPLTLLLHQMMPKGRSLLRL
ncbi:hypothetical protein ACVWZV_006483 [Bradyrhizobium sp. GM5.1]